MESKQMVVNLKSGIVGCALLVLSAQAIQAADDLRLDDAWKAAMQDSEGVLSPSQLSSLNVLAYESAVARICDGFKLEEKGFSAAVSQLATTGDKLTDDEEVQRLSAVMYMLGTASGLFIAEGTAKKDEFCAAAAELKADKDHKHNWQ
jgi:hypothetical protein